MASRSDATVLLTGETGTGKEVLASHIHNSSPYSAGAFVRVDCGAVPPELMESELFGHEKGAFSRAGATRPGKFEHAHNGTLFLDEIGEIETDLQAKLVRALQLGEFNRVGSGQAVRVTAHVISATCCDLSTRVGLGKFREDVFRCVSGITIRVPPLRDRREDMAPMARYFLEDFCVRRGLGRKTFDPTVWKEFEDYSWPGNARQLQNVVEGMAIRSRGDFLRATDVPPELKPDKTQYRFTIQ